MRIASLVHMWLPLSFCLCLSCDDDGTEADRVGVAWQCTRNEDCLQEEEIVQICLTNFKGGYCGIRDCMGDIDCPEGSACVHHTDGVNYCFRICIDKADCNRNRDLENEANCSSNITFVDNRTGIKACVPPSSG